MARKLAIALLALGLAAGFAVDAHAQFFDPTHPDFLTTTWPGWTTDEEILKNQAELAREIDPKKRFAIWEQQHRVFYEKVPVARYGDLHGLHAMRSHVKGYNERLEWIRFQNVWLDK